MGEMETPAAATANPAVELGAPVDRPATPGPAEPTVGRVRDVESLNRLMERVVAAQAELAKLTQSQVDAIFSAAAVAGLRARVSLARMAVAESGMGVVEDKVIKNHFATETVHAAYRNVATCGVIESSPAGEFVKYAEPVGLLAGVVPCTNPTSTAMFKCLLALKTRNCIVISPHPRTTKCTIEAARIIRDAALAHGAPANCIAWIDEPTPALCGDLMKHDAVQMIVATGAGGLVKAAYSSGKPATGGGAGNTPVIIDETADVPLAVNSILLSKTFDNGMICASEQSVVCVEAAAAAVRAEFERRGAVFLTEEQKRKVGDAIVTDKVMLNPAAVGQSPAKLASIAGIEGEIPKGARLLIGEITSIGPEEKFSHEKLCPALGFLVVPDFETAVARAYDLVCYGGMGHTSVMYTDLDGPEKERRVALFQAKMPTGRALICMPSSQGAIGKIFNFFQMPSLSLGCGSWGHNSSAEALQVKHLLNVKEITTRQAVGLPLRAPREIFRKPGGIVDASASLAARGARQIFLLTYSKATTQARAVEAALRARSCSVTTHVVDADASVSAAMAVVAAMRSSAPDTLVIVGNDELMHLGKAARLLHEAPPGADLRRLAVRFLSTTSRIVPYPHVGEHVRRLVAVATCIGGGAEFTPFAFIRGDANGSAGALSPRDAIRSPGGGAPSPQSPGSLTSVDPHNLLFLCDQDALAPTTVVVDVDLLEPDLAPQDAVVALANALESHVSLMASPATQSRTLPNAARLLSRLPAAFAADRDVSALYDCFHASGQAGLAVGNSGAGLALAMATACMRAFELPLPAALACVLRQVIVFNAEEAPTKMGTFAQYTQPKAQREYAEIAADVGIAGDANARVEALVRRITDVCRDTCHVPLSLQAAGVPENQFAASLDNLVLSAFDGESTLTNPRYPLIREIRTLFEDAYVGRVRRLTLAGPDQQDVIAPETDHAYKATDN